MGFSRQEYWSGLPFPSPNLIMTGNQIFNTSEVFQNLSIQDLAKTAFLFFSISLVSFSV